MNRYIIIGIIGIGLVALFWGTSDRGPETIINIDTETDTRIVNSDFDRFASVSLTDYSGNNVVLEEFRGRPLVINSWAVWCPFCVKELPDFAKLQKEFGDQIVVISIDRQEPLLKAKGFTDGLGITDQMLFLLDSSDAFYKKIGGFSMPETIFVNSAGEILVHKRGPMELSEMREHVNKIINLSETSL